MIDGNGKSGTVIVCIFLYHLRQMQPAADVRTHRHTDQPFAVNSHEIDVLRCGGLGAADEIALIFPVRIIGTEDDRVERAIEVIGEYSRRRTEVVPSTASYDIGRYASFPMEVQVGGATIFVVDVEQFVKL